MDENGMSTGAWLFNVELPHGNLVSGWNSVCGSFENSVR
jgi:hypothetical protein